MTLPCDVSSLDTLAAKPYIVQETSRLKGQDTLASLYKRYSTLTQQLDTARQLLETERAECEQSLKLAVARDRANDKLQRKRDRILMTLNSSTASSSQEGTKLVTPPASPLPSTCHHVQVYRQKHRSATLQAEYQQWERSVKQHQQALEQAKQRAFQTQHQLVCLQQIYSISITTSKRQKGGTRRSRDQEGVDSRHHDMEMRHALLDMLISVRDLYQDWLSDMVSRWLWILDDDNNNLKRLLPERIYQNQLVELTATTQTHLNQDNTLQTQLYQSAEHVKAILETAIS